jgi:hypothetical protein
MEIEKDMETETKPEVTSFAVESASSAINDSTVETKPEVLDCWETLQKYPENEINTTTFQIRSKITKLPPVKEYSQPERYKVIALFDSKDPQGYHLEYEHKIIADHFVHNPDPTTYTMVDHKDHNKSNNHPSNLRFVSPSFNARSRTNFCGRTCVYTKTLPPLANRLSLGRYDCKGVIRYPYLYSNGDVYEELRGGGTSEFRLLNSGNGFVCIRLASNGENKQVWISLKNIKRQVSENNLAPPQNEDEIYEN